jgi:hypothetical protein
MSPTFRHSVRPPFATIELLPRLPQEVYNCGFSLAKRVMNLSLLRLLVWGSKSEPGLRGPQHGTTCMMP